jgi:hypothetical protein
MLEGLHTGQSPDEAIPVSLGDTRALRKNLYELNSGLGEFALLSFVFETRAIVGDANTAETEARDVLDAVAPEVALKLIAASFKGDPYNALLAVDEVNVGAIAH